LNKQGCKGKISSHFLGKGFLKDAMISRKRVLFERISKKKNGFGLQEKLMIFMQRQVSFRETFACSKDFIYLLRSSKVVKTLLKKNI